MIVLQTNLTIRAPTDIHRLSVKRNKYHSLIQCCYYPRTVVHLIPDQQPSSGIEVPVADAYTTTRLDHVVHSLQVN